MNLPYPLEFPPMGVGTVPPIGGGAFLPSAESETEALKDSLLTSRNLGSKGIALMLRVFNKKGHVHTDRVSSSLKHPL